MFHIHWGSAVLCCMLSSLCDPHWGSSLYPENCWWCGRQQRTREALAVHKCPHQTSVLLGKSCVCSLLTPSEQHKAPTWPVTLPYQEIKNPQNLCWVYRLEWEYLPLFQAQYCSFVPLKVCTSSGTNFTTISVLHGEGSRGPSTTAQEGCALVNFPAWPQEKVTGHGGTSSHYSKWSCFSLLYVSRASFHPALDVVMFSLAVLRPRCSRQKSLESSLGIDNWCMVFYAPGIGNWCKLPSSTATLLPPFHWSKQVTKPCLSSTIQGCILFSQEEDI